MLAGELQRYQKRVDAGEVEPVAAPPPPPLAGDAKLSGLPMGSSAAMVSQSLPTSAHAQFGAGFAAPPRPRLKPSRSPSLSLPPMLEMPEPSPHASSFLESGMPAHSLNEEDREEDDEFVGGTCVPASARPAPAARRPQRPCHEPKANCYLYSRA